MNSSNSLVEAPALILHRRKLHACALGSLELAARSTRLQSGCPALPFLPGMPQSRVTQLFTSASRKYRALRPYIPFLPPLPRRNAKISVPNQVLGKGKRRDGLGSTSGCLSTPCASIPCIQFRGIPFASKGSPSGPGTLGRKAAQP